MGNNSHAHEMRILQALIDHLGASGFIPAAVYTDDGMYLMPDKGGKVEELLPQNAPVRGKVVPDQIESALTMAQLLRIFAEYDLGAPTVHFTHQHVTTWGNRGVQVVPGNGCDFISDWHCPREGQTVGDIVAFSKIVGEVADAAGEEVFA